MNAILLESDEADMLTNEAIEVHLQYLRSGLDAIQKALAALQDKIDQLAGNIDAKLQYVHARIDALAASTEHRIDALATSLTGKIGALAASTEHRIDALAASLTGKIEQADSMRAAGDAALTDRLDKLTDKVSQMADTLAQVHGQQKALLWLLGSSGTIAAAVSIARTLEWI
jgi:chromosome segregation ATPase